MKFNLFVAFLANLSTLIVAPTLSAQESEVAQTKEAIETIEVNKQYSVYYFRKEMEKAELDFYDMFNKLTDVEDYKIKCANKAETGNAIKTKVCHPQYFLNQYARETQDAWALATSRVLPGQLPVGASFPRMKDIEFAVKETREEAFEYTTELVKKHPKLLEKLVLLNQKQQEYKAKKYGNNNNIE